jgi:hypothetical protein
MPDLHALDSLIHYEDSGTGPVFVFLHGNAPEDQPDAIATAISSWADRKGLR